MTHDELLEKVELTLGTYISKYYGIKKDVELRSDVIDSLQAFRAVVELHKPKETTPPWEYVKYLACSTCENYTNDGAYFLDYPCPTIEAIEKELG